MISNALIALYLMVLSLGLSVVLLFVAMIWERSRAPEWAVPYIAVLGVITYLPAVFSIVFMLKFIFVG